MGHPACIVCVHVTVVDDHDGISNAYTAYFLHYHTNYQWLLDSRLPAQTELNKKLIRRRDDERELFTTTSFSLIFKCSNSRHRATLLKAFITYVRPRLEYATPTVLSMFCQRYNQSRMWANAQRNGRPAEYRWRPLRKFANSIPCTTPQSLADGRCWSAVQ